MAAHPVEPRLAVLHAMKLKGFAEPAAISGATGLSEPDIQTVLDGAGADGLAARREGRVSGWSLTAPGHEEHARLLREEVETCGCRNAVADAYRRFLALNDETLALCTAWQLRDDGDGGMVLNDHADGNHDASVVSRLEAMDAQAQPICADLAGSLERLGGYGQRLSRARERVQAGDVEWFTRPVIDSYHTVWFELHEDLLCTLGIERSKEASA